MKTEYYKEQYKNGLEYQDFVMEILARELGLAISCFCSRKNQIEKGESIQGIEIKYNRSDDLYIEVAEKTDPDISDFTPSGIYDTSWLYIIGDYKTIFIFPTNWLRRLHRSGDLKTITIPRGTSQGFWLPPKWQKLAAKIIHLNETKGA